MSRYQYSAFLKNLANLTGDELTEGVHQVLSELKPIGDDLISRIQLLDEKITALLIPPILTVPASKQNCLEALETFNKRVSVPIREQNLLVEKLGDHSGSLSLISHITGYVGFEEAIEERRSELSVYHKWDHVNAGYIYSKIDFKGQSDELKRWWKDEAFTGSHVVKRPAQLRHVLELSDAHYSLPSEIMRQIYSVSSLESCCALRQVSKAWYAEFEQSHVMRSKLQTRNPWIKPGEGDLRSWQDCVLVFVARLKWPSGTSELYHHVHVTKNPCDSRLVVPKVLKFGETLPDSFEPLFDESELIKMYTRDDSFTINVKSMEMTKESTTSTVEYTGADKTVIRYQGVEFSLPPGLTPRDYQSLYKDVIIVSVEEGTVILPRDNPVAENAYFFAGESRCDPNVSIFSACNLVFLETRQSYEILDLQRKQTVKYCDYLYQFTPLVAYNGCLWFKVMDSLLPTFVDLETETLYYNPDRIIVGVDDLTGYGYTTGSRDMPHLAHVGTREIDLVSGERTEVMLPNGWSRGAEMFLGFDNGLFSAYCMSAEDVGKMKGLVEKEYGVTSDDYDSHEDYETDEDDEEGDEQ